MTDEQHDDFSLFETDDAAETTQPLDPSFDGGSHRSEHLSRDPHAGAEPTSGYHPPAYFAPDAPAMDAASANGHLTSGDNGHRSDGHDASWSDPTDVGNVLHGLETRDVSAWFGKRKVLDRVSLTMQPGQVTALIGPSGCGKSTYLRILNRMHEMVRGAALAGEVLLDGGDIYASKRMPSEVRRRIGMVFQKPNPFPTMSIHDNVLSGPKLAGVRVDDKESLVEESLRAAGLWEEVRTRLRSPGGALSGGQQQRLCIARALALAPDVLLMDEPCSALDPTSTRRVEETIASLENQVTIVIVTHNMQQAARVSSDCAFFLATHDTPGHVVEFGPTEQMFGAPEDPRTADYVNGRFG